VVIPDNSKMGNLDNQVALFIIKAYFVSWILKYLGHKS
jgi:hypothetical protein